MRLVPCAILSSRRFLSILFIATLLPALTGAGAPSDPPPARSPMMREIQAALKLEKELLESLQEQIGTTLDQARRIELQQQIEKLKTDTEVHVMEIQLKHARNAGHEERVQALVEAVRMMKERAAARETRRAAARAGQG